MLCFFKTILSSNFAIISGKVLEKAVVNCETGCHYACDERFLGNTTDRLQSPRHRFGVHFQGTSQRNNRPLGKECISLSKNLLLKQAQAPPCSVKKLLTQHKGLHLPCICLAFLVSNIDIQTPNHSTPTDPLASWLMSSSRCQNRWTGGRSK